MAFLLRQKNILLHTFTLVVNSPVYVIGQFCDIVSVHRYLLLQRNGHNLLILCSIAQLGTNQCTFIRI